MILADDDSSHFEISEVKAKTEMKVYHVGSKLPKENNALLITIQSNFLLWSNNKLPADLYSDWLASGKKSEEK